MSSRQTIPSVLLVVLTAGFVLSGVIPTAAMAKAPMSTVAQSGNYSLMVGRFQVTALSDGTSGLPADQLLRHITPEQVKARLAAHFEKLPFEGSVNAFLVNTGDRLILIDTGSGTLFGPAGGKLLQNLKAASYRPDQIDDVLITHMHADHIGGLSSGATPVFPNAFVHIAKADTDYWLDNANLDHAPAALKPLYQDAANAVAPYAKLGRLKTFEGSGEIVPGITSVPLPGHTAGHTAYLVESDGQSMLAWGDVVHVASIQFADPSVSIVYDSDGDAAARERRETCEDAAWKGYLVAADHISFPGLGHVVKKGDAFEWTPIDYSASR